MQNELLNWNSKCENSRIFLYNLWIGRSSAQYQSLFINLNVIKPVVTETGLNAVNELYMHVNIGLS